MLTEDDIVRLPLPSGWLRLIACLGAGLGDHANDYEWPKIEAAVLNEWYGDDLAILEYNRYRGRSIGVNRLVRDFKKRLPAAVAIVSRIFGFSVTHHESSLSDERRIAYVVSLPGHRAGPSSGPCEEVCRYLAGEFDWLEHLPNAFRRTDNVASSSRRHWDRVTRQKHLDTIRFQYARHALPGGSVLMIDDVITWGATSGACREILRQHTGREVITGMFLAHARPPRSDEAGAAPVDLSDLFVDE